MLEKSATDPSMSLIGDTYELVIDCPACTGTGWVWAVSKDSELDTSGRGKIFHVSDLTIVCPVCDGHSWVPAVAEEVTR